MVQILLLSLGISLILTLALELVFALLSGIRNRRDLLLLCLVNLITNPAVVLTFYLMTYYSEFNKVVVLLLLELAAILVEAYYFKNYGSKIKHPLRFAVCVNVFSYGMGKLFEYMLIIIRNILS